MSDIKRTVTLSPAKRGRNSPPFGGSFIPRLILLFTAWLFTACGAADHSPPGAPPIAREGEVKDLDGYVQKVQRDWKVPGMAVALVSGDRVLMANGYGVLRRDRPERINADTVFQVASITKPFVALLSALLAAEGRWSLDDRVETHLSTFRRAAAYETRETRIRDLLSHRTGLATFEGDLLWLYSDVDETAILSRLGAFPGTRLRTRFGYSNLMYMAAGNALKSVLGRPWAGYLRQRIFEPLQMSRSVIGSGPLGTMPNVASGHAMVDGSEQPLPAYPVENVMEAAGLASSTRDLSHWLLFLVNRGQFAGRQVAPSAVLSETWTPHTIIPIEPLDPTDALATFLHAMNPGIRSAQYGLGWLVLEYRDHRVLMHGGMLPGLNSLVAFVPDSRVGIAVLTNSDKAPPAHAILFRGLDDLLGLNPVDWNGQYLGLSAPPRPSAGAPADASAQRDLIGRYVCEAYGTAEIRQDRDSLVLQLEHHPGLTCRLIVRGGDRYACSWNNPGMVGGEVVFTRTNSMVATLELDPHRYVFTRAGPARRR